MFLYLVTKNNRVYFIIFSDTPRVSLTLSQTLDGAIIRKGDTVYLHCEIKANPTVHTIEWSRDQVNIQLLLPSYFYCSLNLSQGGF